MYAISIVGIKPRQAGKLFSTGAHACCQLAESQDGASQGKWLPYGQILVKVHEKNLGIGLLRATQACKVGTLCTQGRFCTRDLRDI